MTKAAPGEAPWPFKRKTAHSLVASVRPARMSPKKPLPWALAGSASSNNKQAVKAQESFLKQMRWQSGAARVRNRKTAGWQPMRS